MLDKTMIFTLEDEQDRIIREKLTVVYNALKEKGYNPVNQIVGYLLTEDPTYITTYNSARSVMHSMDRDDILVAMLKNFIV